MIMKSLQNGSGHVILFVRGGMAWCSIFFWMTERSRGEDTQTSRIHLKLALWEEDLDGTNIDEFLLKS